MKYFWHSAFKTQTLSYLITSISFYCLYLSLIFTSFLSLISVDMSSKCYQNLTTCCTISLSILFWTLALVFYMLELMFGIWSAILYYQHSQYVLFSVVSLALLVPSLVLTVVSILWYYDQDRLYTLLKEAHPTDEELMGYKTLIGAGSVVPHSLLLGQVYR